MKRALTAAVLLVAPLRCSAVGVTLAWDPPQCTNVIAGYRLYSGPAPRAYTNVLEVGNVTQCTVSNLVPRGTYYFAVTAYDTFGLESPFSNDAGLWVSPRGTNPIVVFHDTVVAAGVRWEWSTNLTDWQGSNVIFFMATNPPGARFFRSRATITNWQQ